MTVGMQSVRACIAYNFIIIESEAPFHLVPSASTAAVCLAPVRRMLILPCERKANDIGWELFCCSQCINNNEKEDSFQERKNLISISGRLI